MSPTGGSGLLLIGVGCALAFHAVIAEPRREMSTLLFGLSLAAFGWSMLRKDRKRHRDR